MPPPDLHLLQRNVICLRFYSSQLTIAIGRRQLVPAASAKGDSRRIPLPPLRRIPTQDWPR
ncbi:hypothetical protein ACLOJK_012668, partial [Asimina triloba]